MDRVLHVLIIEDSEDDALLLVRELRRSGYTLHFARVDTPSAMHLALAQQPWDLILADYSMPRFSAPAALMLVQQHGHDIPFIIVSGTIGEEAAVMAMKAGAHDYLTKDKLARLAPAVERELREAEARMARQRAERALKTSEEWLRNMFEGAPIGIAVLNAQHELVRVNHTLCAMLGYTNTELRSQPIETLIHPEDLLRTRLAHRQTLSTAQPYHYFEQRLIKRNGDILWADVTLTARDHIETGATQVLVMINDTTERKRAEILLDTERRRMAYELHDGLAQTAAGLHHHLQAYASQHRPRSGAAQHALDQALQLAQHMVGEARRMIAGLRPTVLDDFGLITALRLQVEALRSDGWDISYVEAAGDQELAPAIETALFWVAQEALTNIRKHANTRRVHLRLERHESSIRLQIQDWGSGLPSHSSARAEAGEQVGLLGMQERVALLGGRCTIESVPSAGTLVSAEVPLSKFESGVLPHVA